MTDIPPKPLAASSPIDRMTDDALCTIFECALEDTHHDLRIALTVAQVCRQWRACALKLPSLWATFTDAHMRAIPAQLTLSRYAPLTIRWAGKPFPTYHIERDSAWSAASRASRGALELALLDPRRIRTLELHLAALDLPDFGSVLAHLENGASMPLLVSASIHFRSDLRNRLLQDNVWQLSANFLRAAPALRRLELENIYPSWGTEGSTAFLPVSLTHLHVSNPGSGARNSERLSFDGLCSILASLPSLESLRLPFRLLGAWKWDAPAQEAPMPTLALPRLKNIDLGLPSLYSAHALSQLLAVHPDCSIAYHCMENHARASLDLLPSIFPRGLAAFGSPPLAINITGSQLISTQPLASGAKARLLLEFYTPAPLDATLRALCAVHDLTHVTALSVYVGDLTPGLWTELFAGCMLVETLSVGRETLAAFCAAQSAWAEAYASPASTPPSTATSIRTPAPTGPPPLFPLLKDFELGSVQQLLQAETEHALLRILKARVAAGYGLDVLRIYKWRMDLEGEYGQCAGRVAHTPLPGVHFPDILTRRRTGRAVSSVARRAVFNRRTTVHPRLLWEEWNAMDWNQTGLVRNNG